MNRDSIPVGGKRPRVLCVCAGNTCGSVLAEHLARKKFGGYIEVASAGVCPGSIRDASNAIFTLKNLFSLNASTHVPQDVRTVGIDTFDLVVAMDNQVAGQVREIFPNLAVEHLVRWKISDPYGDDLTEYERCAITINTQLRKLNILRKDEGSHNTSGRP